MRVALSGGGWADIREPDAVRNRDRRLAVLHTEGAPLGAARGFAHTDAVLAVLIEGWSLDLPVPSLRMDGGRVVADNIESFDELSPADFDKIMRSAQPARDALFPSFDVDPAPDSPTEPSSA